MTERRLAAIFAADVAGFTAAMARSEESTLADLQALRRRVDPIIEGHGGRIANTAGDSVIAEFASVAEAVDAAVEVQRVAPGGPLTLRIGINVGDVMVTEDGDMFGDGVNVAARLEALADPGGIMISGSVRDSLRGRSPVRFEDLGDHQLKHIDEPVRIHRAMLEAGTSTQPAATIRPASHPELLERSDELRILRASFERAAAGQGNVVLVGGEAGIGKSSLVRAIADELSGAVLWGWCDDLMTPRAFGPFYDMAPDLGPGYRAALIDDPRPERILAALHDALATGPTRLVVIEDLHWADDATIDAIKYLARRIGQLPVMLVLTVRDTGAARVRSTLVNAPAGAVTRLQLAPLSTAAIAALAGEAAAERLRRLTSGNPFFLSEILASGTDEVPASVQDAVLARVEQMSTDARQVAELVSVAPTRIEADVMTELHGGTAGLSEAEDARLLLILAEGIGYRHELARRAVEAGLAPAERRRLNRAVLEALERRSADPARLVHHAAEADLPEAIVRHGMAAARAASAANAHRQALAHWSRVLDHEDSLEQHALTEALEGGSVAAYFMNHMNEALGLRQRVLEIHRTTDPRAESRDHRWISRFHWMLGHPTEAASAAESAAAAVEHLSPTPELAFAYSTRSQLAMLAHRNEEAITWGEHAIELAESIGDVETRIHAMINVATALERSDHVRGEAMLEEARLAAIAAGHPEHACRAYTNLNWVRVLRRQYERAEQGLREGIAYAAEHEIETFVTYLSSTLAWLLMEVGRWDEAVELAHRCLQGPAISSPSRVPALEALTRITLRRGNRARAVQYAAEIWALAAPSGEVQRIAPAAAVRAEVDWLSGESSDEATTTDALRAFDLAVERGELRYGGELARWLHLAGHDMGDAAVDEPYLSELRGRFSEAAERWDDLGLPYEAALAMALGGDSDAAVARLGELGAIGAIQRMRRLDHERTNQDSQAPGAGRRSVQHNSSQSDPDALDGQGLDGGR